MADVEVAEAPVATRDINKPELYGPGPSEGVTYPLVVQYCGACTLPFEYCEYAGMKDTCREWAEKNIPELMQDLDIAAKDDQEDEDKKHQKRGGKGSKPGGSLVGKKSVTVIRGLGANGIDLKQASKQFASKFACGSSVTAADEIVIQGDVKDNLIDLIPEKWPQIEANLIQDLGEKRR
ncbi:unnamed protein product, partial [Mesorhabditis belari]|uniref:SUI1 domain-containing protein n=1 Tax=Mesorhabditis belari TaxID=2138241 RepID=A0AAF3FKZ9_9BILA